MHALFRLDDPLPVPPGRSPFHVRGLYYDRLLATFRRAPGGLRGVLDRIDDASVVEFAEQRFSWNGWYDVLPAMPLCRAFFPGPEFETELRERTRRGALDIIPSIFRLALRLPGPAAIAAQTARIVSTTMDFVHLELEEFTESRSSGWGRGVPLFVAPHTANTVLGFFQAILEMRHAADVDARYTDVVKDGQKHGFETVSIRYEFNWRPRGALRK